MTLYIDTTEFGKVTFTLEHQKKKISKTFLVRPQESDKMLEYLDKYFQSSKIQDPRTKIKKIVIYKGKGSFTGLRIAAAIAQALGMAWSVPVKVIVKKK